MSTAPRIKGFTLVEIMIVIAIIGIIIAIAVPSFLRAREISRARACQENLIKIEGAMDQYALEHKLNAGDAISIANDLVYTNGTGYLRAIPTCPASGTYEDAQALDTPPTCSIGANPTSPYAPHTIDGQ